MFHDTLLASLQQASSGQICNAPESCEAFLLRDHLSLQTRMQKGRGAAHSLIVVRDEDRLEELSAQLKGLMPQHTILSFPGWDCLPYDRVSPRKDLVGKRLQTLHTLSLKQQQNLTLVTSARALLQKLPPHKAIASFTFQAGEEFSLPSLRTFLEMQGYLRVETVREPGEYTFRGGLIDVFPSGSDSPLRLDLFGDTLEKVALFDPLSQHSLDTVTSPVDLLPAGEVALSEETIRHFRQQYCSLFGHTHAKESLYRALSEGHPQPGMEHWLPLFYPKLTSLLDFLAPAPLVYFCHQSEEALKRVLEQVQDHYEARHQGDATNATTASLPYHPVPPESFFLSLDLLAAHIPASFSVTCFSSPETSERPERSGTPEIPGIPEISGTPEVPGATRIDLGAKALLLNQKKGTGSVSPVGKLKSLGLGPALKREQEKEQKQEWAQDEVPVPKKSAWEEELGRKTASQHTFVCCDREEQKIKMKSLFDSLERATYDLDLQETDQDTWSKATPSSQIGLCVFPLSQGFETPFCRVLAARDILGTRSAGRSRRKRRSDLFIEESSTLSVGDLIVHEDHGIGRYAGLHTLRINDLAHDCLQLVYAGEDKLFLPVENLNLITRFGGENNAAALDKLGSKAWHLRRQKVKEDLMKMAAQLIDVAARRKLHTCTPLIPETAFYQEVVGRFPYLETEDQLRAVDACLEDLRRGSPMDRLICGDVGFGKTEIALRVAAAVASAGKQVALIAPTTLLVRQHFLNFTERFDGLGLNICQLSRFVAPKKAQQTKEGLAKGQVQIVIGTHGLLSKNLAFKDLGLIIVDEEQHFGVKQKEHLKNLKTDVHVLTLSATPIPRTLQLSLSGVRDMSLITTPPADRLAVRTFVAPFDPVMVKEAIARERFRGGQIFFVCPRIKDIETCRETLQKLVPTLRIAIATGQMKTRDLEEVMIDFYEKKYDLLLSTNIIESGLDLPDVNTIFIHRSDLFGLSQLYQLRGRVGRGKVRGYAYLTTPSERLLSKMSYKRLEVMQTLDMLGAGFKLASHDMDLRGAGNLLGDAQSGHVKEVGVELYQQMLEDAVTEVKTQGNCSLSKAVPSEHPWTPQLNLGLSVLIPETYVPDLSVRLHFYRRLSWTQDLEALTALQAELRDRFGPLPPEVDNLLTTVKLKQLCRRAGVEKVDVGPKGAILFFYRHMFQAPEALMTYIMTAKTGTIRLKPDQSLSYFQTWPTVEARLRGIEQLLRDLCQMCDPPPTPGGAA